MNAIVGDGREEMESGDVGGEKDESDDDVR